MYSPDSPIFGSIHEHPLAASAYLAATIQHQHQPPNLASPSSHRHAAPMDQPAPASTSARCLRFKYFATFFICTTCLALLSASLATHKWIVAKPIRILRLNNSSVANLTALMLTMANDYADDQHSSPHQQPGPAMSSHPPSHHQRANVVANIDSNDDINQLHYRETLALLGAPDSSLAAYASSPANNNKFQGEVHFGLFNGVKVLNYGFGDRVSQISVVQAYLSSDKDTNHPHQHELVNFKFWLSTLVSVALAILFALIGSILAIINFVMTPRSTLTGPVGLVIWNASACFTCLVALISWSIEYFVHLKVNVLTQEEVQNGWTSENRSQFGYSYYFVVLAFVLHLVNIFIVSLLQFETWSSSKAAIRQSRSACEGVIMLY